MVGVKLGREKGREVNKVEQIEEWLMVRVGREGEMEE